MAPTLLRVVLAALLCFSAVGAECPSGGSQSWPGAGMHATEPAAGQLPACCLHPWLEPTAFGTPGELQAEQLTVEGLVCTSALNLTEFVQASQLGRVGTPGNCTSECSAWGPSKDALCCTPGPSAAVPYVDAVTEYHQVPWIPVDLCPSSVAPTNLLGVDLDEQDEPQCPAGLTQSFPQQLTFGEGSETFLQDSGTYVLAFHRKSNLSPVSITYQVIDAVGNVVVPTKSLTFTSSGTQRRQLLKRSGGGSSGGGRSSSSFSSSKTTSSGSSSSGGSAWRAPSISSMTTSSGRTYTSTSVTSSGYTRYTNSRGYVVPTRTDFTSGGVTRGTTVASTTGGGAVYWGSNSYTAPTSSNSKSYYYGAPASFGNSWYSGGSYRPTWYGYSGPSTWRMALPIIILSRPYGCGYHCHYHHRHHVRSEEQQRELEYITLNLDCDMSMDLVMEGAFRPSDFQAPFTVNIESVTATIGTASGVCESDSTALNSTSTPDSPALFATFVRMEDIEYMDSSSPRLQPLSASLAVMLSLLSMWQVLQHL